MTANANEARRRQAVRTALQREFGRAVPVTDAMIDAVLAEFDSTPLAKATAHAARLTKANVTEADYAYIRAYLYAHSWTAAVDIYGEDFVRAAMLPTDLGHDPAPHSDQVGNPDGCPPGAGPRHPHQQ
jgi:hypothetical protein